MSALKTLAAAMAATLLAAACAPGATTHADPADAPSRAWSEPATVKVQNFNWQDVVVYVVQSSQRVRLGMVTSMSTGKFRLPDRFLASAGDIRLLADPIGSPSGWTTEGIRVHSGQEVELSVQNSLALSSVAVWNR